MTSKDVCISFGAFALLQGVALAQHTHHAEAAQAPAAPLTACVQVQPAVDNIIAEAMRRLEGARQTNDPAQMRAAVDHFGSALRDLRTQLAPCAAPAAAADPHAGHAMPKTAPPAGAAATPAKPAGGADPHAGHETPAKVAAPGTPSRTAGDAAAKPKSKVTADPHAGHQMPAAKPAPAPPSNKPRAAAKPKTTTPKAPVKASDPHAGHAEAAETKTEMDPVNGLTVDPSTAPKTTHQGRTYYFSSEQSLKQFLENPAKFVKPPKK